MKKIARKKITKLKKEYPALEISKSLELINPTQKLAIYKTLLTKRPPRSNTVKAALSEICKSNMKNHTTTITGLIRFRKLFWCTTNPISFGKANKFK